MEAALRGAAGRPSQGGVARPAPPRSGDPRDARASSRRRFRLRSRERRPSQADGRGTSPVAASRKEFPSGGQFSRPHRIDKQVESYDVLVVGGGLAGIRAAIAAVEANPRIRVGMVSKVYPMRSHTVSAEGGAAAALGPGDSFETHAFDTIKDSDYLADQEVVEAFVREAPVEIIQMEH